MPFSIGISCSFEDPELYMRRTERRKRGSFDFVKEGKLQKQAQIGRLRVRSTLDSLLRIVFAAMGR